MRPTTVIGDDEMFAAMEGDYAASDALLLGRRTYETFAASWPQRGSEVPNADWMNTTPKFVASTTLRGRRLFEDEGDQVELALADSRTYDNGVISLTYRPTVASDSMTAPGRLSSRPRWPNRGDRAWGRALLPHAAAAPRMRCPGHTRRTGGLAEALIGRSEEARGYCGEAAQRQSCRLPLASSGGQRAPQRPGPGVRRLMVPSKEADRFEVRVERRGATVVVAFRGDLDVAAADAAGEALRQALSEESPSVLVDLGSLEFMDSTGFHCLVGAKLLADESGRRLAVLNGSGPAHRLLSLTGADLVIEMVDSVDQLNGSHHR